MEILCGELTSPNEWNRTIGVPAVLVARMRAGNIRKAREYVEDVMRRLRESSQLVEAVEPSELYTTDDGDWKLQDGAIHGLARVGHDHKPYLLPAPPRGEERDEEGDAKAPPARFDVALTVLVPDCEFDAWYEYEGAAQPMSGSLTGKVDMVRVDLVIGREYTYALRTRGHSND